MRRGVVCIAIFVTVAIFVGACRPAQAYVLKQSSTQRPLIFQMLSAADGQTPITGIGPTVTISKNGGTFAAPAGAVSEVGSGWYLVAANATDTNTLGVMILHATGSGASPTDTLFEVVAYDPQAGSNLGLAALPTAASGASNGLPTLGTGAGQISLSGGGVAVVTNADKNGYSLSAGQSFSTTGSTGSVLGNVGGSVGSVTAPVSVGGYSGGQDPGTIVWNFLTGSAFVTSSFGQLVTQDIDATIASRSTYAGTDTSGTSTLLSRIPGVVQAQSGDVYARLGAPAGASIAADIAANLAAIGGVPAAVLNSQADGSLTLKQIDVINAAMQLDAVRTWSAGTHTAVYTWYRRLSGGTGPDTTRPLVTKTTVYDSTNSQVISQSIVFSNLP